MSLWSVRFGDGNRVPGYTPPKNTSDPRAQACESHHVGCDCREAMVQEDIAELVADRDEWKRFAKALLREMGEDDVLALAMNLWRELGRRSPTDVPF